jgi:septal ring factor EnvC (AmiA/AmiB activator)
MPIKRFYRSQRARLTARPLAVRPALGVKAKLVRGILIVGVLLATAYAGMYYGQYLQEQQGQQSNAQQQNQLQGVSQKLAAIEQEKTMLAQQLTITSAERDALKRDLNDLQQESTTTREALSFFESLLQSNDRSRAAQFVACELQADTPERWRYRLLLVQGTDKTTELAGRLMLNLQYSDAGKKQRLAHGSENDAVMKVKHYQRLEGELTLPATASGPMLLDVRFVEAAGGKVLATCQKKI